MTQPPTMLVQRFYVPFLLPGLNDMLAGARQSKGKWQAFAVKKVQVERDLVLLVKRAKLKPVKGPVWLRFTWHEANKKRDLDNVAAAKKFVNDSLVTAGILKGDGWAHVHGFTDEFVIDRAYPGVEVVVEEITTKER